MTKFTPTALLTQIQSGTNGGYSSNPVEKTIAFDGTAGKGLVGTTTLYTVTGINRVRIMSASSETLVGASTISAAVSGAGNILGVSSGITLINGAIWTSQTVWAGPLILSTAVSEFIINDRNINLVVAGANVTDGTLKFLMSSTPLSDGAHIE